jgi:molecular chaperone DnaK (HSP70)
MSGRLAVDFGTSNTVLAVWDERRREGVPLDLSAYSHRYQQGVDEISCVPSLIHYTSGSPAIIGNQVLQQNLASSPRTFRWMKRYIGQRSPIKLRIDGAEITHAEAGKEFLSTLLTAAAAQIGSQGEEIALTVPVEAYEHYEEWLAEVAESAGFPRFRLIDEPSAAALGYGAHILPGSVYLFFDFGGGTMHAAVILIESEENGSAGRRCRVLGKAGKDIGGTLLDQWLFQDVLRRQQLSDADDTVRPLSAALLLACESVKEQLSTATQAQFNVSNPFTGFSLHGDFSRTEFEDLLDEHGLYNEIDSLVRSALNNAQEHGYKQADIQAAILVGGSSQIPSVQRTLRQIFGRERVMCDHPLDAIARGAAAFVAGVDFYDTIQHDYAIRYVNSQKSAYDYKVIVPHGTAYPTQTPVSNLAVKATYDGQAQLGLAIYEIGEQRSRSNGGAFVELVFDPSGAARIVPVSPQETERRTTFWMNETCPTFLNVNPPARQGEACFEVEFEIDGNKRLLITAREIKTGRLAYEQYPVVRLT